MRSVVARQGLACAIAVQMGKVDKFQEVEGPFWLHVHDCWEIFPKDAKVKFSLLRKSGKKTKPCKSGKCGAPEICHRSNVIYQASCMLCDSSYIGMTTRALHTRALEHIAGARKHSLKSAFGEHYKNKHPKMAPSLNFRILHQCRDELHLHIEEALAIQRHRPPLNRCDEDMGTGFLIWSALCCLSRSRSCSRYLCADNVAIYLHFHVQLIGYYLSFSWTLLSFFYPFFVSSFDPLAFQSRFHLNLAKAFLASLYMRTTIFLSSCMVS